MDFYQIFVVPMNSRIRARTLDGSLWCADPACIS
jgi:hypothetical protein